MADEKTTATTSAPKKTEEDKKTETKPTEVKVEEKSEDTKQINEEAAARTGFTDDPVKAWEEGRTFDTTGL